MSSVHVDPQAGVFKFLRSAVFFEKPSLCDELVWTLELTVGIKLRIQITLV